MERERSLSIIKAARLLVLSLTIITCFSLTFIICLFNSSSPSSSLPKQTLDLLFFNVPNSHIRNSSGFQPPPPILTHTHFQGLESIISQPAGFVNISSAGNKSGINGDEKQDQRDITDPSERKNPDISKSDNTSEFNPSLVFNKRLPSSSISNESVQVLDTAVTYLNHTLSDYKLRPSEQNQSSSSYFVKAQISDISSSVCDFTKGRWVYDDRLPLYNNDSCPFIDQGFDCQGNGRSHKDYMKWRWQLEDCQIPRFNATQMLEIIRGKRLVFVGDSINRNQWESMLCLLLGAIKDPKRVYETHRRRITKEKGDYVFKFVDYKCTIEYYVTHFLVHESKARVGKKRVQTLRIDTMDRGSSRWKGADILVFNTAHWWTHSKTKSGINYYQEGDQVHPHLDAAVAFRRALTTWASWVDRYINPHKTHVFFRTSSPSHFSGGQWNSGGHCKEANQPLGNLSVINNPEKNAILEEVLGEMKTPVTVLNITRMSEYRIDSHPSLYGRKKLIRKPYYNVQDCSHWCLPGVPDSWNELLYYNLYFKTKGIL